MADLPITIGAAREGADGANVEYKSIVQIIKEQLRESGLENKPKSPWEYKSIVQIIKERLRESGLQNKPKCPRATRME